MLKNKLLSVVIVLIVALAGSTSALAEHALPGDLLYGVKTGVNEPVAGLFAVTGEDKAEWKERLVERRLDEAQKLIAKNNLDAQTRADLENRIKNQIADFTNNVNELAKEKNQSAASSDINIRMQASLNAYQSVLATLATSATTDTKNQTQQLLTAITTSNDNLKTNDTNLSVNVDASQKTAEDLLNSTEFSYQKEKDKISVNIQNQISAKFNSAEAALADGKNFVAANDEVNARAKFQNVIDEVNSAKLLMLSNVKMRSIESDSERHGQGDWELDD